MQWHRAPAPGIIAFIPQTAGAMLGEVGHVGAQVAAEERKCHLYWNAPTSENDIAGQVSLIDRVGRGKYQGLVLAPNHRLAILAPLRRARATGLPVVIISADLQLPAGDRLGYVVNDDEKMGELAAEEIARLIHGRGAIAMVGLSPFAPGVTERVRSADRYLATRYPAIRVVSRGSGAYNPPRAEELTNAAAEANPDLNGVLGFTAASTRGAHAALRGRSLLDRVRLVGCEQDSDLIGYVLNGDIAAVVAEDTYRMGYEAVGLVAATWQGHPMPARTVVPPWLITRKNVGSGEAARYQSFPR